MNTQFSETREYKNRKCFKCKRNMKFSEFYVRNRTHTLEYLLNLWQSKDLEFYCCLCYDSQKKLSEIENIKNKLEEKEISIIKILENRFRCKIPLVSEIKYNTLGFSVSKSHISGLGLFKLGISQFPKEILYLSELEILNLAWNKLENLPLSFKKLKALKQIDLIANNLKKLPKNLHLIPNLQEIDVSFNRITKIPDNLEKSDTLERINLIKNPLNENLEIIDELKNCGINILL